MKWPYRIINLIKNYAPTGDNIAKSEGKRLFVFTLPITFMLIFYAFITHFVLDRPILALWELGCAALGFSSNFIYSKTKNYDLAGNVLTFSGLTVLSVISFYTGGAQGSVIFWIYLCPLCSGMVMGKKAIRNWGIACVAVLIGFLVFDDYVQAFPGSITDEAFLVSIKNRTMFGTLCFSILMSFIYQSIIDKNVDDAEASRNHFRNLLRLVSHDINNSLFLIQSSSTLLDKMNTFNEKEKNHIDRINRGANTIAEILAQVKDIEALRSGKIDLELKPVYLCQIVENAISNFEQKYAAKDIALVVNKKCEGDIYVWADEVSLSNQVINNLLTNALKFSNEGSTVTIEVNDLGEYYEFSVKDNGIGMDRRMLKEIFDASKKTTREGTSGEKGTGFGMPLMKIFIDHYGGRVKVESKTIDAYPYDHGTVFTISFKKAPVPQVEEKIAS